MLRYKNPICIYHKNCPDGFGSAWAIWTKFKDKFEYYPAGYDGEPPPDVTGRDVFLTDFSYSKKIVEEMMKSALSITLIDHHIKAIEDLKDVNIEKYTDLNKSGCVLTWNFFHEEFKYDKNNELIKTSKDVPLFLQYIQDRDLWKFELPNSKEISLCILSYEYDFEVWEKLSKLSKTKLVNDGQILYKKHIKDINELIKLTKKRISIGKYNGPIANMPYCYASDACDIMGMNESFACTYYIKSNGIFVFSIRSEIYTGVNVNELARKFGGGGHTHSAGFELPQDHEFVKSVLSN